MTSRIRRALDAQIPAWVVVLVALIVSLPRWFGAIFCATVIAYSVVRLATRRWRRRASAQEAGEPLVRVDRASASSPPAARDAVAPHGTN